MCVMIAYQVARDLVVELSDRVVQVEYAAYCGMGCMFESGSVILKMDEGHKQELGVEAVGLIMRGNTHDLYVKLSQQEDFDMFAVKVRITAKYSQHIWHNCCFLVSEIKTFRFFLMLTDFKSMRLLIGAL